MAYYTLTDVELSLAKWLAARLTLLTLLTGAAGASTLRLLQANKFVVKMTAVLCGPRVEGLCRLARLAGVDVEVHR
jgi:hypothetical protein